MTAEKITCLEVNDEALRFTAFICWPFLLLSGSAENNRLLSGTSQMDDTKKITYGKVTDSTESS